jgi:hypothetical protein
MANFINRKMSPFSFIFFFQLPRRLLGYSLDSPRFRNLQRRPVRLHTAGGLSCWAAWNMDDVTPAHQHSSPARSKWSIVTPRNNGRPSVESTHPTLMMMSLYISFLCFLF